MSNRNPRNWGGGRKKGTPNKLTQDLVAICEKHGHDPFEALIYMGKNDPSPDRRLIANKEACKYIYPTRKAIEVQALDESVLANAKEIKQIPKEEAIKLLKEELLRIENDK